MKTKTCHKCRLDKALSLFSKNNRRRDGLCHWCKECMRAAVKAWNKRNRMYKNAYNREHYDSEYHRAYGKRRRKKQRATTE